MKAISIWFTEYLINSLERVQCKVIAEGTSWVSTQCMRPAIATDCRAVIPCSVNKRINPYIHLHFRRPLKQISRVVRESAIRNHQRDYNRKFCGQYQVHSRAAQANWLHRLRIFPKPTDLDRNSAVQPTLAQYRRLRINLVPFRISFLSVNRPIIEQN